MKKISLDKNVFELIGDDWMLVAATNSQGKSNAMTASWGGMGVLWGKPVAFVFIRPQRYTREFVEDADVLSLSFFDEEYRKVMAYMGKASGRNEDKIAVSGLTQKASVGAPVFEEASLTLMCRKLYVQRLEEGCFLDATLPKKWYVDNDFHYMYVVSIEDVIKKPGAIAKIKSIISRDKGESDKGEESDDE